MPIMLIHKCKQMERDFPVIDLHQNFGFVNYFQLLKLQIFALSYWQEIREGLQLHGRDPQMRKRIWVCFLFLTVCPRLTPLKLDCVHESW